MTHYHRIVSLLTANTGARRIADVFEDFVEMAALAIRNAVDRAGRARREEQYLLTAGRYTREQLDRFAEALALVVEAMGGGSRRRTRPPLHGAGAGQQASRPVLLAL
ncbi:hypothetical protein [Streptomyces sp. NPDC052042]|uniref:hypothetical protein n=1 Tax=Streptomyces sp. NPDC052042 TaxID=3365683 RepID=UPI0037D578B2